MTTEQTNVLVFKDQAGEYYLLPQATLEQGRVPAEQKAVLEEQLAAISLATGEGVDVQGYMRCEDARVVAQIYRTASLALFGLRDYERSEYFSGVAQGLDIGCSP